MYATNELLAEDIILLILRLLKSTAVATPEEDLLGLSQLQPSSSDTPQSAFDFINPTTTQPAEAGFTPALGSNLTQ